MPASNRSETRVLTRIVSVGDWKCRGFFRSHCGQFLSMHPANLAATARTLEKGAISTKETAGPLARQLRCGLLHVVDRAFAKSNDARNVH